jgi:hypothetical protein
MGLIFAVFDWRKLRPSWAFSRAKCEANKDSSHGD